MALREADDAAVMMAAVARLRPRPPRKGAEGKRSNGSPEPRHPATGEGRIAASLLPVLPDENDGFATIVAYAFGRSPEENPCHAQVHNPVCSCRS